MTQLSPQEKKLTINFVCQTVCHLKKKRRENIDISTVFIRLISSFPSWLRGFDSLRLLQLKRADFTFWEVKSARFLCSSTDGTGICAPSPFRLVRQVRSVRLPCSCAQVLLMRTLPSHTHRQRTPSFQCPCP